MTIDQLRAKLDSLIQLANKHAQLRLEALTETAINAGSYELGFSDGYLQGLKAAQTLAKLTIRQSEAQLSGVEDS